MKKIIFVIVLLMAALVSAEECGFLCKVNKFFEGVSGTGKAVEVNEEIGAGAEGGVSVDLNDLFQENHLRDIRGDVNKIDTEIEGVRQGYGRYVDALNEVKRTGRVTAQQRTLLRDQFQDSYIDQLVGNSRLIDQEASTLQSYTRAYVQALEGLKSESSPVVTSSEARVDLRDLFRNEYLSEIAGDSEKIDSEIEGVTQGYARYVDALNEVKRTGLVTAQQRTLLRDQFQDSYIDQLVGNSRLIDQEASTLQSYTSAYVRALEDLKPVRNTGTKDTLVQTLDPLPEVSSQILQCPPGTYCGASYQGEVEINCESYPSQCQRLNEVDNKYFSRLESYTRNECGATGSNDCRASAATRFDETVGSELLQDKEAVEREIGAYTEVYSSDAEAVTRLQSESNIVSNQVNGLQNELAELQAAKEDCSVFCGFRYDDDIADLQNELAQARDRKRDGDFLLASAQSGQALQQGRELYARAQELEKDGRTSEAAQAYEQYSALFPDGDSTKTEALSQALALRQEAPGSESLVAVGRGIFVPSVGTQAAALPGAKPAIQNIKPQDLQEGDFIILNGNRVEITGKSDDGQIQIRTGSSSVEWVPADRVGQSVQKDVSVSTRLQQAGRQETAVAEAEAAVESARNEGCTLVVFCGSRDEKVDQAEENLRNTRAAVNDNLRQIARDASNAGDPETEANALKQLREKDPTFNDEPKNQLDLAEALQKAGNSREAIDEYNRYLEVNELSPDAEVKVREELARTHDGIGGVKGNSAAALERGRIAQLKKPAEERAAATPQTNALKDRLESSREQNEKAVAEAEAAVTAAKDEGCTFLFIGCGSRDEKVGQAEENLRNTRAAVNDNLRQIAADAGRGNNPEVEADALKALRTQNPEEFKPRDTRNLAEALQKAGNHREAIDEYDRYLKSGNLQPAEEAEIREKLAVSVERGTDTASRSRAGLEKRRAEALRKPAVDSGTPAAAEDTSEGKNDGPSADSGPDGQATVGASTPTQTATIARPALRVTAPKPPNVEDIEYEGKEELRLAKEQAALNKANFEVEEKMTATRKAELTRALAADERSSTAATRAAVETAREAFEDQEDIEEEKEEKFKSSNNKVRSLEQERQKILTERIVESRGEAIEINNDVDNDLADLPTILTADEISARNINLNPAETQLVNAFRESNRQLDVSRRALSDAATRHLNAKQMFGDDDARTKNLKAEVERLKKDIETKTEEISDTREDDIVQEVLAKVRGTRLRDARDPIVAPSIVAPTVAAPTAPVVPGKTAREPLQTLPRAVEDVNEAVVEGQTLTGMGGTASDRAIDLLVNEFSVNKQELMNDALKPAGLPRQVEINGQVGTLKFVDGSWTYVNRAGTHIGISDTRQSNIAYLTPRTPTGEARTIERLVDGKLVVYELQEEASGSNVYVEPGSGKAYIFDRTGKPIAISNVGGDSEPYDTITDTTEFAELRNSFIARSEGGPRHRAIFQQAQELVEARDFAGAARILEALNEEAPNANTLYNAARAYEDAGDKAKAAQLLQKYVAENPRASDIAEVTTKLAGLKAALPATPTTAPAQVSSPQITAFTQQQDIAKLASEIADLRSTAATNREKAKTLREAGKEGEARKFDNLAAGQEELAKRKEGEIQTKGGDPNLVAPSVLGRNLREGRITYEQAETGFKAEVIRLNDIIAGSEPLEKAYGNFQTAQGVHAALEQQLADFNAEGSTATPAEKAAKQAEVTAAAAELAVAKGELDGFGGETAAEGLEAAKKARDRAQRAADQAFYKKEWVTGEFFNNPEVQKAGSNILGGIDAFGSRLGSYQALSNLFLSQETINGWQDNVNTPFFNNWANLPSYLGTLSGLGLPGIDSCNIGDLKRSNEPGRTAILIRKRGGALSPALQLAGEVHPASGAGIPIQCIQNPESEPAEGEEFVCSENNLECRDGVFCYAADSEEPALGFFYKVSWGVASPADEEFTPFIDENNISVSFNVALVAGDPAAARSRGSPNKKYLYEQRDPDTGVLVKRDETVIGLTNGASDTDVRRAYLLQKFDKVCIYFLQTKETKEHGVMRDQDGDPVDDNNRDGKPDGFICQDLVPNKAGQVEFGASGGAGGQSQTTSSPSVVSTVG